MCSVLVMCICVCVCVWESLVVLGRWVLLTTMKNQNAGKITMKTGLF